MKKQPKKSCRLPGCRFEFEDDLYQIRWCVARIEGKVDFILNGYLKPKDVKKKKRGKIK